MKKTLILLGLVMGLPACSNSPSEQEVLTHYADLAQAMYEDSLLRARDLQLAVDSLLAQPGDATLMAARKAWIEARAPYMQTEAYRFGNAIVDDWEGRVNAWPLDEGLIDYVAPVYGTESDANPFYTANIIANPQLTIGGEAIDAGTIDAALLADTLHEAGGIDVNVAIGYHALEFLLWGQDLNGTGPGAGNRPASDFDLADCTNGHCDRRSEYLRAVADLLVNDLVWIVDQWKSGGTARNNLLNGDSKRGLAAIMTGLGSLSYGELAGERMKLGLILHDPEEEQDCFSDNTHRAHYYDAQGIKNVYTGQYTRINGTEVSGASMADLVANKTADLDRQLRAALNATMDKMQVLVDSAEQQGEHYDQLIAADNEAGNRKVSEAIDALLAQTQLIEKAVNALELGGIVFEGSDSLDKPDTIQ